MMGETLMGILQLRKRELEITVVISGQIIVIGCNNIRDLALASNMCT
jgi:hypothetical protein